MLDLLFQLLFLNPYVLLCYMVRVFLFSFTTANRQQK